MRNFFVLFVCCFFSNILTAQNAEQRFLENLTEHRTPGMTHFMQGLSNTTTVVSLSAPSALFIADLIHHDNISQQKSLYIFETIAVGTGAALVLKYIINRPRPSTQEI